MTTKAALEEDFIKIRSSIFKLLGKKAQSDDAITKFMTNTIGSKYQGTFAWDDYKPITGQFAIVNTGSHTSKGVHWTALYPTNTNVYIYDSFHRAPAVLFPHLAKRLESSGRNIHMAEVDKQQRESSEICGQNSMAWILLAIKHGVKAAICI